MAACTRHFCDNGAQIHHIPALAVPGKDSSIDYGAALQSAEQGLEVINTSLGTAPSVSLGRAHRLLGAALAMEGNDLAAAEEHLQKAVAVHRQTAKQSDLCAQNLCRAWIGADYDNIASQKGMARAGFHHVADLVIERVLAMRPVSVIGLPEVPESIVAEARRAFLNERDQVWIKAVSSTIQEDHK